MASTCARLDVAGRRFVKCLGSTVRAAGSADIPRSWCSTPSKKGIFLGYRKEMLWVKEHKNLVVGVCTFCPETRFSTEGKIGKPSENQRELDDLFDHISARLICTSATAE